MKCPVCGQGELVADTRDIPYFSKGQTMVIHNVAGEYCEACGDAILEKDESRRVATLIADMSNG
ncbi:type II toxin-antitoxin system MqsA family antitoxin [Methylovorus glucosotrophus]|jgi:HTH-type transcriptional regulator / antitoxin MqsA|uniref:type II toxin-antitoxin system MqsA family antitoxin n=1 Tax=Methylovorus glucosotrophus TaxID=266009 RepID=UPI0009FD829A